VANGDGVGRAEVREEYAAASMNDVLRLNILVPNALAVHAVESRRQTDKPAPYPVVPHSLFLRRVILPTIHYPPLNGSLAIFLCKS
jgi:hypothetical protein